MDDKEKIKNALEVIEKMIEYKEKMANQTVTDDLFKESSAAFTSWLFHTIDEIKKILEK